MSTPIKYLSLKTAAAMLEVSERTIRRRIASGHLRGKRTGDSLRSPIRVVEADVHAMLRDIPTA